MENYEKKYKEALARAIELLDSTKAFDKKHDIRTTVYNIFPELKESEDESIRKALLEMVHDTTGDSLWVDYGVHKEDALAWLEKQKSVEEIVERCKNSWYNEGKIAGMAEGITDEEKYQQGWHDAIEKQGEQNSAWNNGYSNGYIQAVEKAVEWLENHNDYIDVKDGNVTYFDMEKCVKDFRKAMNGGEE